MLIDICSLKYQTWSWFFVFEQGNKINNSTGEKNVTTTGKPITINVLIDIDPKTLETIVQNEKKAAGFAEGPPGSVDTAGKVGELISRFLDENGFDRFANDQGNYSSKKQKIVF